MAHARLGRSCSQRPAFLEFRHQQYHLFVCNHAPSLEWTTNSTALGPQTETSNRCYPKNQIVARHRWGVQQIELLSPEQGEEGPGRTVMVATKRIVAQQVLTDGV